MNKFLGFVILLVFIFSSCTTNHPTINYKYPHEGYYNNAALAVKDYEPVGIIIVKSSEIIDEEGYHTGSKITSEMLMLEAKKLDANDVINIKIDINIVEDFVEGRNGFEIHRTTYNYTATALAIKYTKAVTTGNTSNNYQNIGNKILSSESESETETNTNSKVSKAPFVILGILAAAGIGGVLALW